MSNVLLMDDHPVAMYVIKQMVIERGVDCEVYEAIGFMQAEAFLAQYTIDFLCVDLNLNGDDVIDWLNRILLAFPNLHVMVYSANNDVSVYKALLTVGVKVIVVKSNQLDVLKSGVEHWLKRLGYCCPVFKVLNQIYDEAKEPPLPKAQLSKREQLVYDLIQRQLSTSQIAKKMKVEKGSIAKYRQRINRKLK